MLPRRPVGHVEALEHVPPQGARPPGLRADPPRPGSRSLYGIHASTHASTHASMHASIDLSIRPSIHPIVSLSLYSIAPENRPPRFRRREFPPARGLDYVDLFLIHFPIPLRFVPFEERYPPEWTPPGLGKNPCPSGCREENMPVHYNYVSLLSTMPFFSCTATSKQLLFTTPFLFRLSPSLKIKVFKDILM